MSGYGANFQIGGCRFPAGSWFVAPLKDGAVVNPSVTVYLSDSGTKALNSTNPATCVTVKSVEKDYALDYRGPRRIRDGFRHF